MNITKLQYFITVYEEGSITAAANKHFVTQVAMTQQIKSLEDELQVELFKREKKRLVRTSAAALLYEKIRVLLHEYDHIIEEVQAYAQDNRKLLRIGIDFFSIYYKLKDITAEFEDFFPDVHITFHFNPSNELISELDKDHLDIILIWEKYVANLGFITVPAFTSRAAVLVRKDHPLAGIKNFSYSMLKGNRVLLLVEELTYFRRTGQLDNIIYNLCEEARLERSDVIISDSLDEALFMAVEDGVPILTYEDKLYKISEKELTSIIVGNSFMDFHYVFARKPGDNTAELSSFMEFYKRWTHGNILQ